MCPTVGLAAAANPISVFNGINPSGTWNLVFVDFFNGDRGVNSWSMELCTESLSSEDFDSIDFSFYPNPNSGNFTIKFGTSELGNKVQVSIHDILGKFVYGNTINNLKSLEDNLSVENLKTGLYIMKVQSGIRSVTERLAVKNSFL